MTVLGVGSTTPVTTTTTAEDGTQQTEQLPRTLLTLALTQEDAQKVILASKTLDVTFALLTKDSNVRPTARDHQHRRPALTSLVTGR